MSDDDRDLVAKLRDWADIYAYAIVSDELLEAAGEIERLRRWQADAVTLLNDWCDLAEDVYEAMGKPPAFLGRPRVDLVRHACTTCATFPTYPYDEWRYDDMNGWSNPEDDPATPTETALLDEIRQLRTQIPDVDTGDGETTPTTNEQETTNGIQR